MDNSMFDRMKAIVNSNKKFFNNEAMKNYLTVNKVYVLGSFEDFKPYLNRTVSGEATIDFTVMPDEPIDGSLIHVFDCDHENAYALMGSTGSNKSSAMPLVRLPLHYVVAMPMLLSSAE